MVESIVLALLKTLSSFLFDQYLQTTVEVKIDGAPSWYYQDESNYICSFSYRDGDYSQVENLKIDLLNYIQKDLQTLNDRVIYENFGRISKPDERQIVDKFKIDRELNQFVRFNIEYKKIEYRDEINRVFGKGCIKKSLFLSYSKDRLRKIDREVSLHREEKAFDELENGMQRDNNRYFKELDGEF